jgi:hypothetical protein
MHQDQRLPRVVLTQFSFGHGGTGRVALHLANGLSEQADVHLIVTMRGGVGQRTLESIDVHKVNVHYLLQRKPALRVPGQIIAVPMLARKLRALRPDVVVAPGTTCGNCIRRRSGAGKACTSRSRIRWFALMTDVWPSQSASLAIRVFFRWRQAYWR